MAKLKQKFDRGDLFSDQCPSREVLSHVTSKWGVLIFFALSEGEVKRFSELRRQIKGISEKMLTQTLKLLEQDEFILRTPYDVIPPYVEYSLTKKGLEVAKHVIGLAEWIEANFQRDCDLK